MSADKVKLPEKRAELPSVTEFKSAIADFCKLAFQAYATSLPDTDN